MLKYHVTRVIHGFGANYCYLLVIFRSRQKSCILSNHPQSCETACPQQKNRRRSSGRFRCSEVAVEERFKQELMYRLSL